MAEVQIIGSAEIVVFDIFSDFKLYGAAKLVLMAGDHRNHQRVKRLSGESGNVFG
jgi:hypothetical protein